MATDATATKESVDLSGQTLGDFMLLRRLGEGGMGQVYLAEQVSLKRRVALKLLRKELSTNESSRKRFKAEAEAVAQLSHSNIVQVFSIGQEEGLQFMALEYVDGRNLKDFIARRGPPELPLALSIMRQAAAALQRAHELGIIHRDIKPENILLTKKGEVKVADFGLSRMMVGGEPTLSLTQSGTTMGTPLYMSPEQVEGKPLDIRTDIYSLGVTCYHMITGEPPFIGENAYAVAIQHVKSPAPVLTDVRPDFPPQMATIIAKMMAKKPEDRYSGAREIIKDLKQVSESLGTETTQSMHVIPPPAETDTPPSGTATVVFQTRPLVQRPLVMKVAASLLAAFGVGGLIGWMATSTARPAAQTPGGSDREWNSPLEQEAALRTLVSTTENPKSPADKQRGQQDRIYLTLAILRQREVDPQALQRAKKFLQEEIKSKEESYQLVGKVGEAIVLAFEDKAKESCDVFMGLRSELQSRTGIGMGSTPSPIRTPELLRLVSDALEHNRVNLGENFPKDLDRLRQPTAMRGGRS